MSQTSLWKAPMLSQLTKGAGRLHLYKQEQAEEPIIKLAHTPVNICLWRKKVSSHYFLLCKTAKSEAGENEAI